MRRQKDLKVKKSKRLIFEVDGFGQLIVTSICFAFAVVPASKESENEYGKQDNKGNCGNPDVVRKRVLKQKKRFYFFSTHNAILITTFGSKSQKTNAVTSRKSKKHTTLFIIFYFFVLQFIMPDIWRKSRNLSETPFGKLFHILGKKIVNRDYFVTILIFINPF